MYTAVITSGNNYTFEETTLSGISKEKLIQQIAKHFNIDDKTLLKELKVKDDAKGQYFYYLKKVFSIEGYVIIVMDTNGNYVNLFEE